MPKVVLIFGPYHQGSDEIFYVYNNEREREREREEGGRGIMLLSFFTI